MTNSDSGFFFGSPAAESPDENKPGDKRPGRSGVTDIEAIEVAGEPVSRAEAKSLGYASFGDLRTSSTYANTRLLRNRLPQNLGDALAEKMEMAWNHLRRNELDEAMTLAQEVAWEKPDLVASKLLIARCFIVRNQNDKALAILLAIPEPERDSETMYYVGLCQSRLSRPKEAIVSLQQSQATSTDTLIRRRAGDLLLSLQGEQAVCPLCGLKSVYESMIEIGDNLLCPNCAKKEFEREAHETVGADAGEDEEKQTGTRRRKRLRPPLSYTEMIIRGVFILFLGFVLFFSVYLLYLLAPEHYAWLRSTIPFAQNLLPPPPFVPPPPSGRTANQAPRIIPSINFDSPPLLKAMAEVPITHQLSISGMHGGSGLFNATMNPDPAEPFKLDGKKGIFTWTPSREDTGKTFTISFGAVFGNAQAKQQVNRLVVSGGPRFRRLGTLSDAWRDRAAFMLASDVTGDGATDLALFSGDYWHGDISILSPDGKGNLRETAKAALSGRPAGVGFIKADEEKWLAVADFWNSRLRFFAFRNQTLSEMSVDINLPGRPILAGFNTEASLVAVLCRVAGETRLVCYRQTGQLDHEQIGDWKLPDGYIWRRIFVLTVPGGTAPTILAVGSSPSRAILLMEPGEAQPKALQKPGWDGVLIDAALSSVRPALHCLWDKGGKRFVGTLEIPLSRKAPDGAGEKPRTAQPAPAEAPVRDGAGSSPSPKDLSVDGPPALGGFAVLNQTDSSEDVLILGVSRLGAVFNYGAAGSDNVYYWPLPAPARLFGQLTPISELGAKNPEAAFIDADGNVWAVALSE